MSRGRYFLCLYFSVYFTVGHFSLDVEAGRRDSSLFAGSVEEVDEKSIRSGVRSPARAFDSDDERDEALLRQLRRTITEAKRVQDELREARQAQRVHLLKAVITVLVLWRLTRFFFRCFWTYVDGHS